MKSIFFWKSGFVTGRFSVYAYKTRVWTNINKIKPRISISEMSAEIRVTLCSHILNLVTWIIVHVKCKGNIHPATGRGGPRGSASVEALDFLDVRHYKGGRSSAIRTGCLYPRRNLWYSFSRGWVDARAHGFVGATEKIPSDTTGNRSRDRPTSALTTTLPQAPLFM
jgi:hypothetical protein